MRVGTAVYIFNIVRRLTLTNLNVTLDGSVAKTYTIFPNITDEFMYNVPIFSVDSLADAEHTVTVTGFPLDNTGSLVLFDYAIYTWVSIPSSWPLL